MQHHADAHCQQGMSQCCDAHLDPVNQEYARQELPKGALLHTALILPHVFQ